jgi:PBP1b-binding outer membrane lipoprotein LpoB
MKSLLLPVSLALLSIMFLDGCVAAVGNRSPAASDRATLGQQLIDLQRAKETGAITEAEFQVQKERLLNNQ